ncbi:DNA-binding XRE family transcriptional regulator [Tenacibaculum gallaicum]|uniref:DNA-binding XRE family transcriptional regulator n=1 Tax=Tenacibaculum gallaicum TaxID=561505 RepID=A0A3E0I229_9FLAO|nr:helix-turn-helix transcriptional regulator [Tenacibaculum gallaicum]REH52576.1 DNA-binding XRE family transcriptional regulator [Tenacibaculum gallaicum]
MSFFGKNIKKIRSVKRLSQQAFAELFDLKRATLGAYEEGRSEPKIDTIIKIANYFSIPIDNLLTSELTVNNLLQFKENLTLETEKISKETTTKIPCITKKVAIQYLEYYNKTSFIDDLPKIQLPINSQKKLRAYIITNLEMANHDNGLYPKDIVIGEFIPDNIIKNLKNGELTLTLVKNELILRRLHINDDSITLCADHKNVPDKVFPLKDIKELWKIQYVFFNRVPDFNTPIENKLSFLEQELFKLKRELE